MRTAITAASDDFVVRDLEQNPIKAQAFKTVYDTLKNNKKYNKAKKETNVVKMTAEERSIVYLNELSTKPALPAKCASIEALLPKYDKQKPPSEMHKVIYSAKKNTALLELLQTITEGKLHHQCQMYWQAMTDSDRKKFNNFYSFVLLALNVSMEDKHVLTQNHLTDTINIYLLVKELPQILYHSFRTITEFSKLSTNLRKKWNNARKEDSALFKTINALTVKNVVLQNGTETFWVGPYLPDFEDDPNFLPTFGDNIPKIQFDFFDENFSLADEDHLTWDSLMKKVEDEALCDVNFLTQLSMLTTNETAEGLNELCSVAVSELEDEIARLYVDRSKCKDDKPAKDKLFREHKEVLERLIAAAN